MSTDSESPEPVSVTSADPLGVRELVIALEGDAVAERPLE
jgi:hypothetical protein